MNLHRTESDQSLDNNLEIILRQFESLKGQLIITETGSIERLIAIGEDDWDYYYITYDGRKTRWNTCVGKIIALKGFLRTEDYNHLIHSAELNHNDQLKGFSGRESKERKNELLEFVEYHKKTIIEIIPPDRYLTEICWDLN
jgi:hypothetical protein